MLEESTGRGGGLDDNLHDALQGRAAQDTIWRIHFRTNNTELLHSVVSSLVADGEKTRSNSVESFVVQNNGMSPVDLSVFFSRYRLSKLKRLHLHGCRVSPLDLVGSQTMNLTTLSLVTTYLYPIPALPQLLGILPSNPLLQSLALLPTMFHQVPDGDGSSSPVPLRHLKAFDLTSDFRYACKSLNRLELPDRMDNMKLTLYNCPPEFPRTLGPYIGDHVRRRGRYPGGGLGIHAYPTLDSLDLNIGDVHRDDDPTKVKWFVEVIAVMAGHLGYHDQVCRVYFDLIAHIPQGQVINLETMLPVPGSEELCVEMCDLEYLRLLRVDLSTWFTEPEISGSHTPRDLLRSQDRLEITRAFLSGSWSPLTNFLSNRAAVGNRISSLKLSGDWRIDEDVIKSIECVVDVFQYDDMASD